jgi:hypothetical protein
LYLQKRYIQGWQVDVWVFCRYKTHMATKRGRPRGDPTRTKAEYLEVRLDPAEKQAFKEAADLAGLALSAWVRERLRIAARAELDAVGRTPGFLQRVIDTPPLDGGEKGLSG